MKAYKITVNGRTYEVAVEESAVGSVATAAAPAVPAAPAAPITPAAPVAPAAPEAPVADAAPVPVEPKAAPAAKLSGEVIKAPMPGTILSVKVKVGDAVEKGTVLCILEAMKMENEIMAGHAGTVTAISVSAGDLVNPGAPLLSLG